MSHPTHSQPQDPRQPGPSGPQHAAPPRGQFGGQPQGQFGGQPQHQASAPQHAAPPQAHFRGQPQGQFGGQPQGSQSQVGPYDPNRHVAGAVNALKLYGKNDNQVAALKRINVNFDRSTFTAIMGPSGSGKSTLMHCLAGLDRITDGQVFLGGEDISRQPDAVLTRTRRDRVGFIFQAFNLLPTLTAEQNIMLPLDLAGRKADKAFFDRLVDQLGLRDRLGHRPSELSGGQQQRVAVARALVTRPEVVFADEPTGALDTRTGTQLLEFLQQSVHEGGQSIIMVTHDPRAAGYADRAVLLVDGHIVDDLARPNVDTINTALARLEEAA